MRQAISAKMCWVAGSSLEMHLHTGVGRYMCGEETALLNALGRKKSHAQSEATISTDQRIIWKANYCK